MQVYFENTVPGTEGPYDSWVECFNWRNLWSLRSLCRVNKGYQSRGWILPRDTLNIGGVQSLEGCPAELTWDGEKSPDIVMHIYAKQENLLPAPRLASRCLLNKPCLACVTLFCHWCFEVRNEGAHEHTAYAEKPSHRRFVSSIVVEYSVHNNDGSNKYSLHTVSL